jgi:hypothetical protein
MIKINLLPPHVVEKRKVRGLAILLLALLLFEIGGLFFYYSTLVKLEKEQQQLYTDTKTKADYVRGLKSEAAAELDAAGKVLGQVAWYDGILQHNAKIADTLIKINEYIYAKMTINSWNVNGASVTLQGATKDLDHVASAYLNLLRSPYITPARGVTFSPSLGVAPSGPQGGPQQRPGGPRGAGPPALQQGPSQAPRTVAPASGNPNEAMGVTFRLFLKPEYAIGSGALRGVPGAPGAPSTGPNSGPLSNLSPQERALSKRPAGQ